MSGGESDATYDARAFARQFDVSRETMQQLEVYADTLRKWQSRINLVGPKTLQQLWNRHFADSAQVVNHIPAAANTVADLGSGAGFPGLVIKALRPTLDVTLIEADSRKAAFLTQAAAAMSLSVTIVPRRIEEVPPASGNAGFSVVTARALAPLPALLTLAAPLGDDGTLYLFLKGQNVESELLSAAKCWTMNVKQIASQTHQDSRLLQITRLRRVDI